MKAELEVEHVLLAPPELINRQLSDVPEVGQPRHPLDPRDALPVHLRGRTDGRRMDGRRTDGRSEYEQPGESCMLKARAGLAVTQPTGIVKAACMSSVT